jgi:CDP-glucose 4,6-dehydratase
MKNFFKNKKVLITGHTGFQGAWLSYILNKWGAKVVGISLEPPSDPNLFTILRCKNKVKHYSVDIRNKNKVLSIFKKEQPEIVFHLAAQALVRKSYNDRDFTFSTNVMGTVNILEGVMLCKKTKATVIVTTDKVYENKETGFSFSEDSKLGGHDPYSASKSAADIITQSYIQKIKQFTNSKNNQLIGIARSGNVIGGGDWGKDRLIPDLMRSIYQFKIPMIIRNPDSVRPWQHVFEALSGYLKLSKKLYQGDRHSAGAWNFGPDASSIIKVEKIIKELLLLLKSGSYKIKADISGRESKLLRLNNSKSKKFLNWEPTLGIKSALEWTASWYRTYYENSNEIIKLSDNQIKNFFNNK